MDDTLNSHLVFWDGTGRGQTRKQSDNWGGGAGLDEFGLKSNGLQKKSVGQNVTI